MLRSIAVATRRIGSLLPRIPVRYSSDLEQYTIYDVAYCSLLHCRKRKEPILKSWTKKDF